MDTLVTLLLLVNLLLTVPAFLFSLFEYHETRLDAKEISTDPDESPQIKKYALKRYRDAMIGPMFEAYFLMNVIVALSVGTMSEIRIIMAWVILAVLQGLLLRVWAERFFLRKGNKKNP